MKGKNYVFIASSLDGRIADRNNKIDWLNEVPNPTNIDMGYASFMDKVDAVVMGKTTFEVVLSFGIDWPYTKPVFVLSNSMEKVSKELEGKVEIISGTPNEIVDYLNNKGYSNLYLDGGYTVQSFLKEDLVDEMTITTMPIVLGGGPSLFGEIAQELRFKHVKSEVLLNEIVQSTYIRKR